MVVGFGWVGPSTRAGVMAPNPGEHNPTLFRAEDGMALGPEVALNSIAGGFGSSTEGSIR